jgi:hypothetical protein
MQLSLTDEVVILKAQVEYLHERLADNPGLTNRPVNWRDLTSSDAAERWAELVDWVSWLRDRYSLHERVPGCWYAHGPVLEELSALRSVWVAAFQDKDARPGDGVAFHDVLDRVLFRIARWDRTGCADGTHRPEAAPANTTDQSELERAIYADLTRRERDTAIDLA